MTWLTLAARNVTHQSRQYAAFFLSSAFAVWMFFLFISLQYHPVLGAELTRHNMSTTGGMVAILVAIFAVLFISYASSAFLRARQRELGIFSLVGMLPRQIGAIIFAENLIVGAAAIGAGVGGGIVANKLFFLLVGRVIGLTAPVPFHLSLMAVMLTVLIFAGVFLLVSALGRFTLHRLPVAEVFRSAARPRTPPAFRWWLAGLGLAGLAGGYTLLLWPGTWTETEPRVWPAIILVLAATFLLFHQGSVAALQALRRRPTLYYRRTSLLAVSQMLHKVRDNAKVLFMVSILTTMMLVPLTVVVFIYAQAEQTALKLGPIGLVVQEPRGRITAGRGPVAPPEPRAPGAQPDHVRALAAMQAHGLAIERQAALPMLPSLVQYRSTPTHTYFYQTGVVPVSAFNAWGALTNQEWVTLPAGHALVTGTHAPPGQLLDLGITFGASAEAGPLLPVDIRLTAIATDRSLAQLPNRYYALLIVDDQTFARQAAQVESLAATDRLEMHGFQLVRWKGSLAALEALQMEGLTISGTALTLRELLLEGQTGMLILGFMVMLFFLATGQMLYFKLFTDLTAERQQYQALFRVGLRVRELGRVISIQILVLFFAPLFVALAHARVFLAMMERIDGVRIGVAYWAVAGAYLVLFGGYYLASRRTYVKALLSGAGRT